MLAMNRWLKWTVLLTLWIVSILTLVIVSANSELSDLHKHAATIRHELRLPKNTIRGLCFLRRDPNNNFRPMYSAHVKSLCTENNDLGPFKTALHRTAIVRSLELEFYQYSCHDGEQIATPGLLALAEQLIGSSTKPSGTIIHRLMTSNGQWRFGVDIDFGNITEARVDGFDYRVFYDGDPLFRMQSKNATISYRRPGILLRGCVTLETADGTTLKSNHVIWEVEQQNFLAKGVYVLNRGGAIITGKGICVNSQLKPVRTHHTKSKQKEKRECFARL